MSNDDTGTDPTSGSPGDHKIGGGTNPGGKHPLPGLGHPGIGKTHTDPDAGKKGKRVDEDTDSDDADRDRDDLP
jgi:hypothetical protein